MRVALVNPAWRYEGSIYFGCRAPHLPLELGYAAALMRAAGCEILMLDGQLDGRTNRELAETVAEFRPDMTVTATAPTYLFWRCAPPELTTPRAFLGALDDRGGRTVAVGPHGSTTPAAALRKLGCDVVVRGECEEVLLRLAGARAPGEVASVAYRQGGELVVTGGPAAADLRRLPTCAACPRWTGRTAGSRRTATTITASTGRRRGRAPRWRPRAAAPTPAPSAPSSTSATPTAAGRCRPCSPRSTA
jgi:hypothetical protein